MNNPFEEQIAQALRDAAPAFRKAWLDAARPVMQAVLDEIDRQSIPIPATPPEKKPIQETLVDDILRVSEDYRRSGYHEPTTWMEPATSTEMNQQYLDSWKGIWGNAPIKPKEPQSYPDGYLPIGGPLI